MSDTEIAAPDGGVPADLDRELDEPGRSVVGREARWPWFAVAAIAVAAGVAYGWGASHVSIEVYYAGAVRSMAGSWHAFAFGAFDPRGTVTIDKLPGSFWVQALVVRAFGLSTWTLVAPQIVAGILTVVLMFVSVRRSAGANAGLVAAATTAAMPATAIMSRGNTADAICVLLLVAAADAKLRAIRNGRLSTLVIAGCFVGLAFQAKMIEAWAILPALGVAYAIAAPGGWCRRLGRLGAGGVVAVAVSLSWMTAITLVPAHDRPYVDGSRHDSVYEQVFEYNGVERFGGGTAYGLSAGLPYRPAQARPSTSSQSPTPAPSASSSAPSSASLAPSAPSLAPPEHALASQQRSPSADSSKPGVTRLVTGALGRDTGWLLPLALVAAIGLVVARRHLPPTDPVRAAAILWGIWLITFAVLFSAAGHVLTYYTGALVPPIAALCAIGLRQLVRAARDARVSSPLGNAGRRAMSVVLVVGAVSIGLLSLRTPVWFQLTAAGALVIAAVGVVSSSVLRVRSVPAAAMRRVPSVPAAAAPVSGRWRTRTVPAAAALLALLAVPASATAALVHDGGGSFDAPFAANGTIAYPRHLATSAVEYGGAVIPAMTSEMWRELDSVRHAEDAILSPQRRLAVFTSAQAGPFVLAGVRSVEPIGGFTGLVDAPTLDRISEELTRGEIAYAIVPGPADPRANDPRVQMIEDRCRLNKFSLGTASATGPRFYVCP